jgi:hypothetical protein
LSTRDAAVGPCAPPMVEQIGICHEMDGLGRRVSIGLSLFSLTEWGQE